MKPNDSEIEWNPSNRVKSRTAKKRLFWCHKCDRDLAGQHGRCGTCGYINNKKKIKQ